jgi:16S rRNA (guanine527-N7)-methyltransferase
MMRANTPEQDQALFPASQPEREHFQKIFPVSHETIHRLDLYADILTDWQQRMNLVAPSTLPHLWQRHFFDSAQLFALLPERAHSLVDIGAGAGFPGMVLAILAAGSGRPLTVHLIEATKKKAAFLTMLATELNVDVTVHPVRAETLKGVTADIVTARAVTELADLFRLGQSFKQPGTVYLFLKGEKAAEELAKAQQHWHFTYRAVPSRSDARGKILLIEKLAYKLDRNDKAKRLWSRGHS